jgi:amino-acid N-acetyltransferase
MPDTTPPHSSRTYSVRPATATDLDAVISLLAAASLAPNAVDVQFGPQFAVAVDGADGAVIGAAGIRSAVVDSNWRGLGIGAALTDDRIAWAESASLSALYLLTETAADYWPRFGFERTARDAAPFPLMAAHEWKHGCPSSAVAMRLNLPRRA